MADAYYRQGSASKVAPPKLVTIHWEDGTQSHVTQEHALAIRKQAAGLKGDARVSDH